MTALHLPGNPGTFRPGGPETDWNDDDVCLDLEIATGFPADSTVATLSLDADLFEAAISVELTAGDLRALRTTIDEILGATEGEEER